MDKRITALLEQVDPKLQEDPEYGWVSRLLRNGKAQELEKGLHSLLKHLDYSLCETSTTPYGIETIYKGPLGAWVTATLPLKGKEYFMMRLGEEPDSTESIVALVCFGTVKPDRKAIDDLLSKYR